MKRRGAFSVLLPYLLRYRTSVLLAALGFALASLLGFFNLLLLKPTVEVLTEQVREVGQTSRTAPAASDVAAAVSQTDNRARKKNELASARPVRPLGKVERAWERLTAPARSPLHKANAWLLHQARRNRFGTLCMIALAMLVLAAAKSAIEFCSQYFLARSCYGMVADLREQLFRKIIAQDYLFFARQSTGYLQSRIQSDVASIRLAAETLIRNGFQAPFQLAFLTILLLGLNLRLTLIALAVAVVASGPLVYLSRIVRRVTKQTKREADKLSAELEESLRNFPIVKLFQSEPYEAERFAGRNRALLRCYLKNRLAQYSSAPLTQLATAASRSAVIIAGGYMVLAGQMEFSTLVVYLVALTRFYGPTRVLSRMTTTWAALNVSTERVLEILGLQPRVIEVHQPVALEKVRSGIEFCDVSFSYADHEALENISFRVEAGRVVALVGPSGAGKTTLVCLLARLFDPTRGSIRIDGVDIRRYRLSDLRRAIATVTQEPILFNDTVARNIAYPDTEPDMDRVVGAARAANAHEFIEKLDGGRGYHTVIGQSGQQLSGGQRQRIAIARAFYRDPQILIFDEATSSLDEHSQALVQQAVEKLFKGRTVFVIAHRLSTVRRADEILVLHGGRLIERGTHDELVRRGGFYASLCWMSMAGEKVDLEAASKSLADLYAAQ